MSRSVKIEEPRIEAVLGTFHERFSVIVGDDQVAEIGRNQLLSAAEAVLGAYIASEIHPRHQPRLVVYEQRAEGASSEDGITLEFGPQGAMKFDAAAAHELARVLIAYSHENKRRQWLVRIEA